MNQTSTPQYSVATASLPTRYGTFTLRCYQDNAGKEHVAVYLGDLRDQENVFTRIHSECFTGDVLGSHRCDCGTQLHESLRRISEAKHGLLIYLRQEGRGIGLLNKIRAYDLQENHNLDTVDANLSLGFGEDERTYEAAAFMINDLGIRSVLLNSNNPTKTAGLETHGIRVSNTEPSRPVLTESNVGYLKTKAIRMNHRLADGWLEVKNETPTRTMNVIARPKVTLSYAQSLDGTIATRDKGQIALSCQESMAFVHRLRAKNNAILVGIETVLSDDPRLNVRLAEGPHPQPVILDRQLRLPLESKLLKGEKLPWIFTDLDASAEKKTALESRGARVFPVGKDLASNKLDLRQILETLGSHGIESLLVEGGQSVITSFLDGQWVDQIYITISPQFIGGGFNVLGGNLPTSVQLDNVISHLIGRDVVISGTPRLNN